MLHLSTASTARRAPLAALAAAAAALTACGGDEVTACKVGGPGIAERPLTGESMDLGRLAFVIDGAPTAATTDAAELLASQGIGAAFFALGRKLDGSGALRVVRERGHLVGNATFSGDSLEEVPVPASELRQADELITPFVTGNMFFFRAPGDAMSAKLAAYLNRQGLQKYVGPIGADVVQPGGEALDVGCWREGLTPSACAQRYLLALSDEKKGLVRFTDDGSYLLVSLLQELVPALQSAGFQVDRLDAVPEVRRAFEEREATPGITGGPGGCDDYGA